MDIRKYDALNAVAFAISSPGVVVAVFTHGTVRSTGMIVWMAGVTLGVVVNIVALVNRRRSRAAEEAAAASHAVASERPPHPAVPAGDVPVLVQEGA